MTPPLKVPADDSQVLQELEDAAVRFSSRWIVGIGVGLLTLLSGAAISWAVNVDMTQRQLLQDVSGLQENRENVCDSLKRIEDKVDRLLGLPSGGAPSP